MKKPKRIPTKESISKDLVKLKDKYSKYGFVVVAGVSGQGTFVTAAHGLAREISWLLSKLSYDIICEVKK